jgi:hypothetical protein
MSAQFSIEALKEFIRLFSRCRRGLGFARQLYELFS